MRDGADADKEENIGRIRAVFRTASLPRDPDIQYIISEDFNLY